MKKLYGVAAAVAMALTGCSSVCEDLEDASKTFGERYRPCVEGGKTPTFPVSDTCRQDLDQCTEKEREAVSNFADCIHNLHRCDPDDPDRFSNEVFTCVLDLYNNASSKCLEATGIFGA